MRHDIQRRYQTRTFSSINVPEHSFNVLANEAVSCFTPSDSIDSPPPLSISFRRLRTFSSNSFSLAVAFASTPTKNEVWCLSIIDAGSAGGCIHSSPSPPLAFPTRILLRVVFPAPVGACFAVDGAGDSVATPDAFDPPHPINPCGVAGPCPTCSK